MKKRHSPIRTILYVSLDRFIASVEEVMRPSLRGTPVIVASHAHKNVVASSNQQARVLGIQPSMPLAHAMQKAPQASVISGDVKRIEDFSREFYKILHRFSEKVEAVSLDEAFIDLTGYEYLWISPEYAAQKIKEAILKELELTSSIGVASNKIAAQVAARIKKPNGLVVVPWGKEASFLQPIDVQMVPGIGSRTCNVLHEIGIKTIGDLAQLSPEISSELFGKAGMTYVRLANGLDSRDVDIPHAQRSISRTKKLSDDNEYVTVHDSVRKLSLLVGSIIESSQRQAKTVAVRLILHDGKSLQHQKTFTTPLLSQKEIVDRAHRLLLDMHYFGLPIRSVCVHALNIKHTKRENLISFSHTFTRLKGIRRSFQSLQSRYGLGIAR
ncbi:hypothetical protein ACFL0L_02515 [Patescibacteria group bacterium]